MVLKGHIVEIIPVTVHEDIAYDNAVFIELENGLKISLFYPRKLVREKFIGKEANIKVRIFFANLIEKIDKSDITIIPSYDSSHTLYPYAEIFGRLDYIGPCITNPSNACAELNMGLGSLGLAIYNQSALNLSLHGENPIVQFNVGDYVHIKGAYLFVDDIEVI
jgi:hypothetical protein